MGKNLTIRSKPSRNIAGQHRHGETLSSPDERRTSGRQFMVGKTGSGATTFLARSFAIW